MSTNEPRRFQFTIRDMLAITALTFLGLCRVTPFVTDSRGWPACVAMTLVTLLGALTGMLLTRRERPESDVRLLALVAGVGSAWLLACGPGVLRGLFRSRMCCGTSAGVASCAAYAEAQEIYHRNDHDGDGVLEYAQSLHELYETKPGVGDVQLVDRTMMQAEGRAGQVPPKAGLVFKVLKRQGQYATGGRKSYKPWDPKTGKLSPNMTAGYALVAAPSRYEKGLKTYIINNNGTSFECDLGEKTAEIVEQMIEFDPDPNKGWVPAE